MREALLFGLVIAGRPQLRRAALDLVKQGLNLVEPAEKAMGEFPESASGHGELL
jgi:hypothetical protein